MLLVPKAKSTGLVNNKKPKAAFFVSHLKWFPPRLIIIEARPKIIKTHNWAK